MSLISSCLIDTNEQIEIYLELLINGQEDIYLNLAFAFSVYIYNLQTYTEVNFPIKFVPPRMQKTVTLFH